MGMYDFMINMSQEGRLSHHEDEIEKLKKRVQNLEDWVRYLSEELQKISMSPTKENPNETNNDNSDTAV
jgi:chaperonin cofactor prefoldin